MTEAAEEWVIDRLFGDDAGPGAPQPQLLDGDDPLTGPAPENDRPAAGDGVAAADSDNGSADADAGAKRTAVWLVAGVLAASILIAAAFTLSSSRSHPGAPPHTPAAVPISAAPHTSAALPAPDQAIPFTAAAPGCKGGSTPAQSLSDSTGEPAWVCVRGTPDEQADGQVLHIDFRCDAARPTSDCSYLLTSVSVTPGAVAAAAGGRDDWLAHRVVSRLQYNFYNGNELADILTQDTGNVHGPAAALLRRPVLASHAVVIILQTSRPPATPPPDVATGTAAPQPDSPNPGVQASETGVPMPPSTVSDPVDAAFAVSAMQFYGHPPG